VSARHFAIVNPAAGGGRCGRRAPAALQRLRQAGLDIEVAETRAPGDATRLAREASGRGLHRFVAVGGDGTAYEIVNGLFPTAHLDQKATLGFLPLGTGNSFLHDFAPPRSDAAEHAFAALRAGTPRPCDVLRLKYRGGVLHYINLLSLGFAAEAARVRARRYQALGTLGYLLAVFERLVFLSHRGFAMRVDDDSYIDRRPYLFVSFNNSKFTGGRMLIAPQAGTADGLIELVRWGPIGRLGLLANLPRLFDGTHISHPLASRQAIRRIDFELRGPVTAMVDGEVLSLQPLELDVLPGALDVLV
jgi:YegS/Rv2252/BmrU family lipid kinase